MKKPSNPRTLPIESVKSHQSSPPSIGDEVFTTGVFYWNVTAILFYLASTNSPKFETVSIPVDIWQPSHPLIQEHIADADITKPVIVAEIAPDYLTYRPEIKPDDWLSRGYVLIDGYHRVEKARGLGLSTL